MIPPTPRLPEARTLIDTDRYFVVHAPRQTGKTTGLRTLASELTAERDIAALAFSCERAKVAGDDYAAAESILLQSIREAAERSGWPKKLLPPDPWPQATPGTRFGTGLSAWCRRSPRRIVLLFDEIDALQGNSLVSFLCQLRDGHNARPDGHPFPASVILCGLRDVRDYKTAVGADPGRCNPTSPFNIVTKSLRLGDFTAYQIGELYGQHTEATGQEFTKDAVERVFELTQGQPWLVNAVAHEITFEMGGDRRRHRRAGGRGQGTVDQGARRPPGLPGRAVARAPGQAGDGTDRGRRPLHRLRLVRRSVLRP
ncbi:AAA family ATPase [Nonomuraea ferruginea]